MREQEYGTSLGWDIPHVARHNFYCSTVVGDVVTEHEALALYNAVEVHKSPCDGEKTIYVPVFRVA